MFSEYSFVLEKRGYFIILALLPAGCATVRPVQEQTVYRCGPLSKQSLQDCLKNQHVKTVVNLRGFEPGQSWYQEQIDSCKGAGARHLDLSVHSAEPEREEVIELLETFRSADKPILLIGGPTQREARFAAALYRLAVLGQSKQQARQELALWESRRLPVATLRAHDEFLYEWRGEQEFYAKYQLPAQNGGKTNGAAREPKQEPKGAATTATIPRPPLLDLVLESDRPAVGKRPRLLEIVLEREPPVTLAPEMIPVAHQVPTDSITEPPPRFHGQSGPGRAPPRLVRLGIPLGAAAEEPADNSF